MSIFFRSMMALLLCAFILTTQLRAQTPVTKLPNGNLLVEDFGDDAVGSLPQKWYNRDGNAKVSEQSAEEQAKYRYRVDKEGGKKYLQYSGMNAMHMNLPLRDTRDFTLSTHPILSWEWRVHTLPRGAHEDDDKRNDTAASIYVVYEISGIFRVPKVIRYTWSSSLPKDTYLSKGKQKIYVVESGEQRLGEWIRFERNIAEDYRKFFGEEPPDRPLAILILSDANNTKSFAFADYGSIILKMKP